MNDTTLAIASEFVRAGIEKAGIPLTSSLEAYLSITFAKYIGRGITVDLLTLRVTRAMEAKAGRDEMRALADDCLIACAFFERRLTRQGTVRHYIGLGQMTYDAADMTEQAYGFIHMRDVMASAAGRSGSDDRHALLDRARAGSTAARGELAEQNVIVGPWGGPSRSGLLWR
jgi:hypothetical protein